MRIEQTDAAELLRIIGEGVLLVPANATTGQSKTIRLVGSGYSTSGATYWNLLSLPIGCPRVPPNFTISLHQIAGRNESELRNYTENWKRPRSRRFFWATSGGPHRDIRKRAFWPFAVGRMQGKR